MAPPPWPRNRLLLALPPAYLKRLTAELEPIPCERRQVLLDADSALDDVFFPDSGVVSVVAVLRMGALSRWQRSGALREPEATIRGRWLSGNLASCLQG